MPNLGPDMECPTSPPAPPRRPGPSGRSHPSWHGHNGRCGGRFPPLSDRRRWRRWQRAHRRRRPYSANDFASHKRRRHGPVVAAVDRRDRIVADDPHVATGDGQGFGDAGLPLHRNGVSRLPGEDGWAMNCGAGWGMGNARVGTQIRAWEGERCDHTTRVIRGRSGDMSHQKGSRQRSQERRDGVSVRHRHSTRHQRVTGREPHACPPRAAQYNGPTSRGTTTECVPARQCA